MMINLCFTGSLVFHCWHQNLKDAFYALSDTNVLILTGPSFSGKTEWALSICEHFRRWKYINCEPYTHKNQTLTTLLEQMSPDGNIIPKVPEYLKGSHLIIDHCEWLSALHIDKLDCLLRRTHANNNIFGGVKIVFIGNLARAIPESIIDRHSLCQSWITSTYGGHFTFDAANALQNAGQINATPTYSRLPSFQKKLWEQVINNEQFSSIDLENLTKNLPWSEQWISVYSTTKEIDEAKKRAPNATPIYLPDTRIEYWAPGEQVWSFQMGIPAERVLVDVTKTSLITMDQQKNIQTVRPIRLKTKQWSLSHGQWQLKPHNDNYFFPIKSKTAMPLKMALTYQKLLFRPGDNSLNPRETTMATFSRYCGGV